MRRRSTRKFKASGPVENSMVEIPGLRRNAVYPGHPERRLVIASYWESRGDLSTIHHDSTSFSAALGSAAAEPVSGLQQAHGRELRTMRLNRRAAGA